MVGVNVRDNNVEKALRILKKKMQREGVFREMKLRRHYEKPSEKKLRENPNQFAVPVKWIVNVANATGTRILWDLTYFRYTKSRYRMKRLFYCLYFLTNGFTRLRDRVLLHSLIA